MEGGKGKGVPGLERSPAVRRSHKRIKAEPASVGHAGDGVGVDTPCLAAGQGALGLDYGRVGGAATGNSAKGGSSGFKAWGGAPAPFAGKPEIVLGGSSSASSSSVEGHEKKAENTQGDSHHNIS